MKTNNPPSSAARTLEERARAIATTDEGWRPSPNNTIRREAAFTLEAITELRALHNDLEQRLLAAECRVGTELLQNPDLVQRVRLHSQALALQSERRRLALTKLEQVHTLRQRLLGLVEKHAYLTDDECRTRPHQARPPHP